MNDFFISSIQMFYEGNMYIRPLESVRTQYYLLKCWSLYAQIIQHVQNKEENKNTVDNDVTKKKKEAAEKAHSFLLKLKSLLEQPKQSIIKIFFSSNNESN